MNLTSVIVRGSAAVLAQEITAGSHRLIADEPAADGGKDTGPSPYDLLLASLGACTSMTVSMYARRKGWPLADVTVALTHAKIDAPDGTGKFDRIERKLTFAGPLTPEQRARLIEIANKCPIYRTLTSKIDIQTSEAP